MGYGDVVPSTPASRGFAVVVVLLGLAVLSLATASLAAIFVEKDVAEEEDLLAQDLLREDIRVLRDEVRNQAPQASAPPISRVRRQRRR